MSTAGAPEVQHIHHAAYRCRDAEQTRWFYEDVLGMKLAAALSFKQTSGTEIDRDYMHLFFDMGGGGLLAFFDEPAGAREEKFKKTDGFEVHIAFSVDSEEKMLEFQRRLQEAGTTCVGPLDHGFCKSVYAYDPNGLQIEFAWNTGEYDAIMTEAGADAQNSMKKWTDRTRANKVETLGAAAIDARGKAA